MPIDVFDPEGEPSVLPKTKKKVAGDALTQNVQPGAGEYLPMALAQLKRVDDRINRFDTEPIDRSAMQAYAQRQGDAADYGMLSAMAASLAGERFAPMQAQFLKRAAAAAEPIKVAGGLLTPDGKFIRDEDAFREAQRKAAEGQRTALMGQIEKYRVSEADRVQREREKARADETSRFNAALLAEARRGNALTAQSQRDQAASDKRTRQQETDAQLLSNRLTEIVPLYAKVGQLNDTLNKYVPEGKEVPGFGRGSNLKLGPVDASGLFMNAEDKAVRAQLLGVFNALLQAQSGQAVTMPEEQRKRLELMVSNGLNGYSAEDTLNAYNDIVLPAINATVANTGGGFTPEVKSLYNRQGGKVNFEKPYAQVKRRESGSNAGGLSAQEQAELEALRKKHGRN